MTTTRGRQLLEQGERTRVRLLETARTAIAEQSDASLNAIAKRAGVGIGTLYRHFPTREELIFEIYRNEVSELADAADTLLETAEPLEAFRMWLDRMAQYAMTKAGLVDALRVATAHSRFAQEAYGPVSAALTKLLDANKAAGAIKADVTVDDVLLAVAGLYQLDPSADWRPMAGRLFDFVIAGLRRYD